jgi:hypothetical protein
MAMVMVVVSSSWHRALAVGRLALRLAAAHHRLLGERHAWRDLLGEMQAEHAWRTSLSNHAYVSHTHPARATARATALPTALGTQCSICHPHLARSAHCQLSAMCVLIQVHECSRSKHHDPAIQWRVEGGVEWGTPP